MDRIHQHVRQKLGYCLKNAFIIQVYDPQTKQWITLNQDVLDYKYNPFKLRSLNTDIDISNLFNMVELHVVDYSLENLETNQQASIVSNTIGPGITFPLPNASPATEANEPRCQEGSI
jgi:hypothetical protein